MYSIVDDVIVYLLILIISSVTFSVSLETYISKTNASKQAIRNFAARLNKVPRAIFFGKVGAAFVGHNVYDVGFIPNWQSIYTRGLLSIVILMFEVVYIMAKIRTMDWSISQRCNVGIWVGIYTVTMIASWRFGKNIGEVQDGV